MAESVFFTRFLLLCLHLAMSTGYPIDSNDSDIEEGNAQQRKAYRGMEPSEHAQVAKTLQRIKQDRTKQDNVWWLHKSCMQGRGYTNNSGCTDKKLDKCFGIDISYKHRVEIDEGFPHWVEFLRNFPRCWRFIAPLVCVVHYRPCTHRMMNEHHKYVEFELFPAQLCKEMRLHCEFAFSHFSPNAMSYLSCDARVRGAQKQDGDLLQHQNNTISVYHTDCNLNFYSRKEPVQLMDQATACLTPLVYVNTIVEAQRMHALPLVDECFIPCSSTIYGTQSLSTLNMFTFLCFFVVLMLALLVLLRGRLICDFGMFICLLAAVSTLFIALTFALSPFFGDDVVCLLNGKIRRYSGAFTLANGNDILCFLEATYLKLFLIFAFWASFIIVCNGFAAKAHNRYLLLQQITALCHLLVSSFITFMYREISIDPVSKVCHYFRFRTLWLNLADFLLVLLVAFFIFKLSKRKSLQRHLDFYGQLLTATEQNPSSLIGGSNGKSRADTEHCGAEIGGCMRGRLPFWQSLFDQLIRWIHPLFLLIVYFGCVLSFYMLTEKTDNESDLLTSQINCSLSALSTDKWKGAGHLKSCQIGPQSPLWYYANSLVMAFHLILMLAVILGSMNCHKSDKSVTNGEEETEDENEVELDIITPTSENGTSEQRRNGLGLNYNNRSSVADSIGEQSSNGYAEIDCTAFALTNTAQRGRGKRQSGRKRRLNNLDRSNKARRKRELLMAGKNEADDPMLVQATDTSSVSESASTLYARRHQAPSSPVGVVAYSPCSPSQPHAVSAALPSIFVVHWLHQYCPSGGLYCHQSDHQQEAEPERADFATEKANGEEESGEVGRGANADAQNPYRVEEADEKSEDDEGNAEGDAESEYPISDEEEADDRDSNDFCSDSPDSIEELFWNESCQKAAQHQQPAKI